MTDKLTIGSVDLAAITAAALAGVERAVAARAVHPKGKWPGSILTGIMIFPGDVNAPILTPPWDSQQPAPTALTAHDHTIIIEAIFRQALPLLVELGVIRDQSREVTSEELLSALRKLTSDEEVGSALDRAIAVQKTVAGAEDRLDRDSKARIAKLEAQLRAAETVDGMIAVLNAATAKESGRDEAFAVGLRTGIALLEDGRATIYNPDFYVSVLGPSVGGAIARNAAGGVAEADASGAVKGALVAAAVGVVAPLAEPALVGAGALGGAVSGSASAAWKAVKNWLF